MGTDDDVSRGILAKLDQLLRLNALQMTSGMKQKPAIQMLSAAGFDRRLIAELLNTTPNTVSVTLSTSKAKPKATAKEAAEPEPTMPRLLTE
jgi:DNA-binding CsgD family transcriptional regulator